MSLDFCCNIQMVGSEFGVKNMKAWIHPVLSQSVPLTNWALFKRHSLPEYCPNSPFMTTVYLSSEGYFQQDNAPCHKAQIISDWFLEHDNEFTLLNWPPNLPDLNPIEHLWDVVEREICIMDVQPTNLQQKSLKNVFNTLLNLCHEELRQFWRQKGVQPGTSKVYLIKWPVRVCV